MPHASVSEGRRTRAILRLRSVASLGLVLLGACSSRSPTDPLGFRLPSEGRVLDLAAGSSPEFPCEILAPGRDVQELGSGRFVAPFVRIDRTDRVSQDPQNDLRLEEVADWEAEYGEIPRGSIVLVRTGRPPGAGAEAVHPGVERSTLDHLLVTRGVLAVGTDHGSLEPSPGDVAAASSLQESAAYALLGLRSLDLLPVRGGILVVAPSPYQHGERATVRCLAIVPRASRPVGANPGGVGR